MTLTAQASLHSHLVLRPHSTHFRLRRAAPHEGPFAPAVLPLGPQVRLARETTCTTETYTLPDGRTIRVGAERFTAPEALINPRWAWALAGALCSGVA